MRRRRATIRGFLVWLAIGSGLVAPFVTTRFEDRTYTNPGGRCSIFVCNIHYDGPSVIAFSAALLYIKRRILGPFQLDPPDPE